MGFEPGRTGRRRRRAVGPSPSGAAPGTAPDSDESAWLAADLDEQSGRGDVEPTELPPSDDDERLLRDVPPHHGG